MTVDKKYCMSSFLMYRTIEQSDKTFGEGIIPNLVKENFDRISVGDSRELEDALKRQVVEATADGKAALALSGGIDSAILAKFMPKGSTAYTFKCVVPGIEVTDETQAAARYAEECGLKHKIVEIYWEDIIRYAPALMKHKGAPIHSIEVQIYKAALQAKADGFTKLIFGESADCLYGGLSNVLSRDWKVGEFVERYAFVKPYMVLKEPELIIEPMKRFTFDGYVDVHQFYSHVFFPESIGSYINSMDMAEMQLVAPYMNTQMSVPLDLERVRSGENKYLVREVFKRHYDNFKIPPKTPMPRPTNEWMKDWMGPTRHEFWPHCTEGMTGDQKWLVYCLEWFLNLLDAGQL